MVKSWLWLPLKQVGGRGTVRVILGGTTGFEGMKQSWTAAEVWHHNRSLVKVQEHRKP